MMDNYIIRDIEQIRLLSDPFKLQLIQAFAEGDKTTKQVAEELGESVTRLYRHVDALHDAGLLLITGEKQKRGTVERSFRAVAKRFEADHKLFADENEGSATNAARDMLRVVEAEILDALASDANREEKASVFMRLRCKASPARIRQLRESLDDWIETVQNDDDGDDNNTEEIGGLIALYPIGPPSNE